MAQALQLSRTRRMPKVLCLTGMVVSILILVLFLLDLAIQVPFKRISPVMDIVFVVCAVGLAFISWTTLREQD